MVPSELVQVTWLVRFWVVPSEKVPVRVNCWLKPAAKLAPLGLMAMDWRVAEVTRTTALPVAEPKLAWMVIWPAAKPKTRPLASTVAADGMLLVQATEEVRLRMEPSE